LLEVAGLEFRANGDLQAMLRYGQLRLYNPSNTYGSGYPNNTLHIDGAAYDDTTTGVVGDGVQIDLRANDGTGLSQIFASIRGEVLVPGTGVDYVGRLRLTATDQGGWDTGFASYLDIGGDGTLGFYHAGVLVKDLLAPELPEARISLSTSANVYKSGEVGSIDLQYVSHVFDTNIAPNPTDLGNTYLDLKVNGVSKSYFDNTGSLRTYNIDTPAVNFLYGTIALTAGFWPSPTGVVTTPDLPGAPDGTDTAIEITKTTVAAGENIQTSYNGANPSCCSIYIKGTGTSTSFSFDAGLSSKVALEGPGLLVGVGSRMDVTGLSTTQWSRLIVAGVQGGVVSFVLYPGGYASTTIGESTFVWGPQFTSTAWVEPYQPRDNQPPSTTLLLGGTHATRVAFGGSHLLQTGSILSGQPNTGPGFTLTTLTAIEYGDIFRIVNGATPAFWIDQNYATHSYGDIYAGKGSYGPDGTGTVWANQVWGLGSGGNLTLRAAGASIILTAGVTPAAGAIGTVITTAQTFVLSDTKLLSIQNHDVEKAYFDLDGDLHIVGPNLGSVEVGVLAGALSVCGISATQGTAEGSSGAQFIGYGSAGSLAYLRADDEGSSFATMWLSSPSAVNAIELRCVNAVNELNLRLEDGAGVSALVLSVVNGLAGAGSKIISFALGSSEQAHITKEGSYILTTGLWDDVPCRAAQAGGTSALTQEAYRDSVFQAYFFQHNQDDTLHLEWQMPHTWDPTTSVKPHIHIIPMVNPAAAQNIRFTGKYVWSQVGAETPADASWTPFTVDHEVGTADQFKQAVVALATVAPPTTPKESNILLMWLRRPGSSDAADTYDTAKVLGTAQANVMVVSIDTHFQKVKLGTVPEIP
jgi:hypothetical protein